jgi:hypothetical protein
MTNIYTVTSREASLVPQADRPKADIPSCKAIINTEQEQDIQYWMQLFGVNRRQLFNAIQLVGTAGKDVERFLNSANAPDPAA